MEAKSVPMYKFTRIFKKCVRLNTATGKTGYKYRNMDGLTLNLLTITIVAPPSNASKWQMGFNSAFKGLNSKQQF